jgi:hypothetical protein
MTGRLRIAANLGISLLGAATLLLSACGRTDGGGTPATPEPAPPATPASPPAGAASQAPDAAAATDPSASQDQCQGEPAQYAVGSAYTPEVGEKLRELSRSTVVRVLHPGEVVTMEFRSDRLSITVDANDVITQVTCG